MMIVVLLVDVVTGIMAKELIIKEWIFQGFLGLTVGAFFINSAKSIMHSRKAKKQEEIVEDPTDTENLG
jgi:uncharacterized membrane protein